MVEEGKGPLCPFSFDHALVLFDIKLQKKHFSFVFFQTLKMPKMLRSSRKPLEEATLSVSIAC